MAEAHQVFIVPRRWWFVRRFPVQVLPPGAQNITLGTHLSLFSMNGQSIDR